MSLPMTTTQTELRLAKRMSRLGTETAFEVLVRARALEAQGRTSSTSRSASPTWTRRPTSLRPASTRCSRASRTTGPSAGLARSARRPSRTMSPSRAASRSPPTKSWWCPAASRSSSSPCWRWSKRAMRSSIPNPGFPIYESMINFLGAKAVPIQMREDRDFRLDVNELKGLITDRTKLIIINSPQNPTGGVMTPRRH